MSKIKSLSAKIEITLPSAFEEDFKKIFKEATGMQRVSIPMELQRAVEVRGQLTNLKGHVSTLTSEMQDWYKGLPREIKGHVGLLMHSIHEGQGHINAGKYQGQKLMSKKFFKKYFLGCLTEALGTYNSKINNE